MTEQELKTAYEIVSKANALIDELDLGDEYGESGGLIASYDEENDTIVIQDEAYSEEFALGSGNDKVSADLWSKVETYIREFASAD